MSMLWPTSSTQLSSHDLLAWSLRWWWWFVLCPNTGDDGGAEGIGRARGTKKAWNPRDRSTLTSSETWTFLCLPVVVDETFLVILGRDDVCLLDDEEEAEDEEDVCSFMWEGGGEGEHENEDADGGDAGGDASELRGREDAGDD